MNNGDHEIRTPKGLRIGNRSVVDGKADGSTAAEQGARTQQYEKVCSGCPAQSESQETGAACTGTG